MLLRVVYNDGCFDYINPQRLERLINTEEISFFYRQNEIVALGVDRVRSTQDKPYSGPERRNGHK